MYTDGDNNNKKALQTIADYLAGRKMTRFQRTSGNIEHSFRSSGPETEDQAAYQVTLDDNTVLIFSTIYMDALGCKGFTEFRLSLGT